MFRTKFNFNRYVSTDKPTLFFGIYRKDDIDAVKNHKGVRIIWFAGSDAMVPDTLLSLQELQDDINTVFIAESKWIEEDLKSVGIKFESISLFLDDIYKWKSTPLGNSIFWYSANSSKYGKEYLSEVKKAFPNINIITNEAHSIPREKMSEVYSQCFVGVRPVKHDGMSVSVAEMALMGRYTIWNGDGPFSVKFEGVDGLITAIKGLMVDYNHKLVSKRARMYFIENEAKFTDLIFKLCGASGIDATNMFYEDKKRPASFFRIMRKEDVEKIGGFGDGQFERQWMSEKITSIGKKMLIVSKNSGYNVLEWKGVNNKGYDKGFNNFHTYDKKYS